MYGSRRSSLPLTGDACSSAANTLTIVIQTNWIVLNADIKTRYRPLWDVTIAGPPRCLVWCRLVTVSTDPFTTFTSPTNPFLSEWVKWQRKHPKWQNRTFDRESDGRFWIGKPKFLSIAFHSNHRSISLSIGDIHLWQTDGLTKEITQ